MFNRTNLSTNCFANQGSKRLCNANSIRMIHNSSPNPKCSKCMQRYRCVSVKTHLVRAFTEVRGNKGYNLRMIA